MSDHKYHRDLKDPQEKKSCLGSYYNFKKGREFCKHRDECELYKEYLLNKERYDWDIHFELIKHFRQCKIYKFKQG